MIFDTGSSNIFVTSTECTASTCLASGHNVFKTQESGTFTATQAELTVTYASGQVVGALGRDKITLGGLEIENGLFGRIVDETGSVFGEEFDGIVGCSFPSLADNEEVLFQKLEEQNYGQMSFVIRGQHVRLSEIKTHR